MSSPSRLSFLGTSPLRSKTSYIWYRYKPDKVIVGFTQWGNPGLFPKLIYTIVGGVPRLQLKTTYPANNNSAYHHSLRLAYGLVHKSLRKKG